MRLHQDIGYDHLSSQVGARAFMTRILMISEIIPWPTIESILREPA
jgi:hypothetical protein